MAKDLDSPLAENQENAERSVFVHHAEAVWSSRETYGPSGLLMLVDVDVVDDG